jgi:hypothetical protein
MESGHDKVSVYNGDSSLPVLAEISGVTYRSSEHQMIIRRRDRVFKATFTVIFHMCHFLYLSLNIFYIAWNKKYQIKCYTTSSVYILKIEEHVDNKPCWFF